MARKSPILHKVRLSLRKGKQVSSHDRGSGSRTSNPHSNGYTPPEIGERLTGDDLEELRERIQSGKVGEQEILFLRRLTKEQKDNLKGQLSFRQKLKLFKEERAFDKRTKEIKKDNKIKMEIEKELEKDKQFNKEQRMKKARSERKEELDRLRSKRRERKLRPVKKGLKFLKKSLS